MAFARRGILQPGKRRFSCGGLVVQKSENGFLRVVDRRQSRVAQQIGQFRLRGMWMTDAQEESFRLKTVDDEPVGRIFLCQEFQCLRPEIPPLGAEKLSIRGGDLQRTTCFADVHRGLSELGIRIGCHPHDGITAGPNIAGHPHGRAAQAVHARRHPAPEVGGRTGGAALVFAASARLRHPAPEAGRRTGDGKARGPALETGEGSAAAIDAGGGGWCRIGRMRPRRRGGVRDPGGTAPTAARTGSRSSSDARGG